MYTIHVDGQLLFSAAMMDEEHIVLDPKLSLDVNSAGSLTFVLPPGHVLYNSIHKLKSIITVEQDGKIIFRGRVMDDTKDFYNQKDVYCEGDRSFLLDSQCAPYTYSGTVLELFQKLIADHNSQVDADKQFTIGRVTAVSEDETTEVENVAYWETIKDIDEKLLGAYGGYLMTRTENGTTYLDWLAKSGDTSSQVIEFSVNLLDLKDKVDAADVFTILIPLGASSIGDDGEYTEPVNISSVNDGLNYIQNDAAVAQYGKIWRTKTWNYEEDPEKLLEKGREYLKTGAATHTLTINAIDMHFINGNAQAIQKGAYVRILSEPHGLDITINNTKQEIELQNPEEATYTFGEPPRTLTENVVKKKEEIEGLTGNVGGGGGGKSVKEELKDYIRWADIRASADEAMIELLTGESSKQGERLSKAEITLDGVNAQIVLKADVETVNEQGRRISAAEIEIDGLNGEITLKANKVYVDAEITKVKNLVATEIEAAISDINVSISETIVTNYLTVKGRATLSALALDGSNVSKTTIPVVTSFTQASGESAPRTDYTLLTTDAGSDEECTAGNGETVTF